MFIFAQDAATNVRQQAERMIQKHRETELHAQAVRVCVCRMRRPANVPHCAQREEVKRVAAHGMRL